MHLLYSTSLSPFENIALEESLLEHADKQTRLLFWKSRSAVVLGKNQNPWLELNLEYCREHGVDIARRFSGGGAVYQDEGNLNYAVIHPREGYSMTGILDSIAASFQQEGIEAERMMENALGIDGKKFSGHAFCYRRDRVLHHGTLLINANLDHLLNSLLPGGMNLDSHAVLSRTAAVANLSDSGLDEEQARQMVIRGLESALGESIEGELTLPNGDFQEPERIEKFSSMGWIWGQTPGFTLHGESETGPFSFKIRRMRVESVEGLDGASPLVGCSLLDGEVEEVLENVDPVVGQACRTLLGPFLLPAGD